MKELKPEKTSRLPNLKPARRTPERDVTPRILAWLEGNWPRSALVEIKVKGNRPLPHQELNLKRAAGGTFTHKLKDLGQRNPADAFLLVGADALLVMYLGNGHFSIYNYRDGTTVDRQFD